MAQVSGRSPERSVRTGFDGAALVRLLSRLTGAGVREPRQVTADGLSQWFGWTDAISLSAALNGNPAAPASSARSTRSAPISPISRGTPAASPTAEETECRRVRAALTAAIAEDSIFVAATTGDAAPDFAPFRQRYLARQQAMDAGISPLRGRMRARLAAQSPDMARLAAVDVVMEQVLGAQERSLLAGVPALLDKHFRQLRQAAPDAWLDVFRRDARDVLLAELDLRFQPVEGLLEALRTRQPKIQ
jgi:hypothetical protein